MRNSIESIALNDFCFFHSFHFSFAGAVHRRMVHSYFQCALYISTRYYWQFTGRHISICWKMQCHKHAGHKYTHQFVTFASQFIGFLPTSTFYFAMYLLSRFMNYSIWCSVTFDVPRCHQILSARAESVQKVYIANRSMVFMIQRFTSSPMLWCLRAFFFRLKCQKRLTRLVQQLQHYHARTRNTHRRHKCLRFWYFFFFFGSFLLRFSASSKIDWWD